MSLQHNPRSRELQVFRILKCLRSLRASRERTPKTFESLKKVQANNPFCSETVKSITRIRTRPKLETSTVPYRLTCSRITCKNRMIHDSTTRSRSLLYSFLALSSASFCRLKEATQTRDNRTKYYPSRSLELLAINSFLEPLKERPKTTSISSVL